MREGTTQRIHINYRENPPTYTPTCKQCRTRVAVPQLSLGAAQQRCEDHRRTKGCPK
jgi:hypothetical protein